MKVMIVGSGGREHVIVWKVVQSPLVSRVYAAPGNVGMENLATRAPIEATDIDGLLAFALQEGIDLTIIGPEAPLYLGIVDRFTEAGLKIFGPTQAAAEIERDKGSALDFMNRHGIPTGWHHDFTSADLCLTFVKFGRFPVVIKNPYPFAGKGVVICKNYVEAEQALAVIQRQQEKDSHRPCFLVMQYLLGQEVSITAITDGDHVLYFPPAEDHKRLNDGDQGPMTGGMGAIAPAPYITPELQSLIHSRIVLPTIRAMAKGGRPYKGVLYAGLILTDDGIKALEFNARFGDPEAQVILPLLKTDIVELMLAAIDGTLDKVNVQFYDRAAACVVLVSDGYGYSDEFQTGFPITGIEFLRPKVDFLRPVVEIFHAGTDMVDGQLVTAGGRVLGVTAVESILPFALEMAYGAVGFIDFHGMQYRRDIGRRALDYLASQK